LALSPPLGFLPSFFCQAALISFLRLLHVQVF